MHISQNIKDLWLSLISMTVLSERAAESLYYRAAFFRESGDMLSMPDGIGGRFDLTKLFKQCKIIETSKGNVK
jgi:hypothetical protein